MSTSLEKDLLIEYDWFTFEKPLLVFLIYAKVKHTFTVKKLSFEFQGRSKTNLFLRVAIDLLPGIQKIRWSIK